MADKKYSSEYYLRNLARTSCTSLEDTESCWDVIKDHDWETAACRNCQMIIGLDSIISDLQKQIEEKDAFAVESKTVLAEAYQALTHHDFCDSRDTGECSCELKSLDKNLREVIFKGGANKVSTHSIEQAKDLLNSLDIRVFASTIEMVGKLLDPSRKR